MTLLRSLCLLTLLAKPAITPAHAGVDARPERFHRLLIGIARHEHCPPPLAPTCVSFAGQRGAWRTRGGFAAFQHPEDRWRAAENDIRVKCAKGLTVRQIVGRYDRAYLKALLSETGLDAEERLK